MASEAEVRAALNFGPTIVADATGRRGTFRYDIDGTAQSVAIPPGLRGMWLDVAASADVDWGFGIGTSAPSLTHNANAALGTGSANAGFPLFAGSTVGKRIPYDATFIAWRGASSGGKFSGTISELPTQ